MPESIELSEFFPGIKAERLYRAWMDGGEHTAMTGSPAQVDPQVGGRFTAWEGYISGANLELQPFQRILQAWRASEFPEGSPDSRLEIRLQEEEAGTRLTLVHNQIPDGQGESYRQGWEDFYFAPMHKYFSL